MRNSIFEHYAEYEYTCGNDEYYELHNGKEVFDAHNWVFINGSLWSCADCGAKYIRYLSVMTSYVYTPGRFGFKCILEEDKLIKDIIE